MDLTFKWRIRKDLWSATDKKTGFKFIEVFQELVETCNWKTKMLEKIFYIAGVATELPPPDVEETNYYSERS